MIGQVQMMPDTTGPFAAKTHVGQFSPLGSNEAGPNRGRGSVGLVNASIVPWLGFRHREEAYAADQVRDAAEGAKAPSEQCQPMLRICLDF